MMVIEWFLPIFLWVWKRGKGDSSLLDLLSLFALSIIVCPRDKKELRSHGQPSVASRRFFTGEKEGGRETKQFTWTFSSLRRPVGHRACYLSFSLEDTVKMDGELRTGKMIEEILVRTVFFRRRKIAFHSIDSLFNNSDFFVYIITLFCVFCM